MRPLKRPLLLVKSLYSHPRNVLAVVTLVEEMTRQSFSYEEVAATQALWSLACNPHCTTTLIHDINAALAELEKDEKQ